MKYLTKKGLDGALQPLTRRVRAVERTTSRSAVVLADLTESLRDLPQTLGAIRDSLDSHTIALDAILKNTETSRTEQAATKKRLDRHEAWIHKLAARAKLRLIEE